MLRLGGHRHPHYEAYSVAGAEHSGAPTRPRRLRRMTHDGYPGVRGCGMKKLNFCIAKNCCRAIETSNSRGGTFPNVEPAFLWSRC